MHEPHHRLQLPTDPARRQQSSARRPLGSQPRLHPFHRSDTPQPETARCHGLVGATSCSAVWRQRILSNPHTPQFERWAHRHQSDDASSRALHHAAAQIRCWLGIRAQHWRLQVLQSPRRLAHHTACQSTNQSHRHRAWPPIWQASRVGRRGTVAEQTVERSLRNHDKFCQAAA